MSLSFGGPLGAPEQSPILGPRPAPGVNLQQLLATLLGGNSRATSPFIPHPSVPSNIGGIHSFGGPPGSPIGAPSPFGGGDIYEGLAPSGTPMARPDGGPVFHPPTGHPAVGGLLQLLHQHQGSRLGNPMQQAPGGPRLGNGPGRARAVMNQLAHARAIANTVQHLRRFSQESPSSMAVHGRNKELLAHNATRLPGY